MFTVSEREKLLKDELRRMVKIMKNEGDIEKIILFGSLAAGKVHEGSDIDMLVIKETDKRHIDRIMELSRLIHPKVGMDLFVYTPEEYELLLRERFSFLMHILKTGKVIYEKRNLDGIVDFVETHDLSDYLEQMPEEHFEVDIKTRKYVFTLEGTLVDQLSEIAKSRHITTQELINSLLAEKTKDLVKA